MHGQIKTYLPSKKYGFINGEDGNSYFFHATNIQSSALPKPGQLVEFEETATPKGYRATKIKLQKAYSYLVPRKDFLWSKKDRPEGMFDVYSFYWYCCDRDLNNAKNRLKGTAYEVGANAVLCAEHRSRTESEDNYKYTVHEFSGYITLLAKKEFTPNKKIAKAKNNEFRKQVKRTKQLGEALVRKAENKKQLKFALNYLKWMAIILGGLYALAKCTQ